MPLDFPIQNDFSPERDRTKCHHSARIASFMLKGFMLVTGSNGACNHSVIILSDYKKVEARVVEVPLGLQLSVLRPKQSQWTNFHISKFSLPQKTSVRCFGE